MSVFGFPEFSRSVSPEATELHQQLWPQRGAMCLAPPAVEQAAAWREKLNAPYRLKPEALARLGTRVLEAEQGGVRIVQINAAQMDSEGHVLLFFHGGGYVMGEPDTGSTHALAAACRVPLWSVDYRMAPEHPFPAAYDDAYGCYLAACRRFGAARVVVAGVSAGAGLALAALLRARDEGMAMPAGLLAISPWVDLARDGDSVLHISTGLDLLGSYDQAGLAGAAAAYAGGRDLRDPALSPLHADYSRGLCPTLVCTGTRDWFLSHCAQLHLKLKEAGVDASLEVWEGMGHAFTALPIPEARQAVAGMARTARRWLGVAN